jgi:hypothetical protein
MLHEEFVEDVGICMVLVKSFGNFSFLVYSHLSIYFPLGLVDRYASNKLLV